MEFDPNLIAREALAGRVPDIASAASWLNPQSLADLGEIMAAACRVRQEILGDEVEFCAILNARSGRCTEDCAFCAQSAHHKSTAQVYPLLSASEIVEAGRAAAKDGAQRFGIVTSGRDCPSGTALDQICRAAERLREEKIISPCGSLGLLKPDQARRLADAGFARYHHNLEADLDFRKNLHHSFL